MTCAPNPTYPFVLHRLSRTDTSRVESLVLTDLGFKRQVKVGFYILANWSLSLGLSFGLLLKPSPVLFVKFWLKHNSKVVLFWPKISNSVMTRGYRLENITTSYGSDQNQKWLSFFRWLHTLKWVRPKLLRMVSYLWPPNIAKSLKNRYISGKG